VSKVEAYRQKLRTLPPYTTPAGQASWDAYLLQESGLPGPRGNLELAQAVVAEGEEALFKHYLTYDAERAPTNSPYEFLAFCGVTGLGKLLANSDRESLALLRRFASDPRWRTREGVAIGLQTWGDRDMDALIYEMEGWSKGSRLEQRASVAALCEPHLLKKAIQAARVLHLLDQVTESLVAAPDCTEDDFKTLRKALGYGWSVAVVAYPQEGKSRMEGWIKSSDKNVRWVMLENLKKDRLLRMDAAWVGRALSALQS
jgi:hypothetical protein